MSAVLQAREPSARYLHAVQPELVRQFQLLMIAPGGVARLRELILTLAVQGRLVPQDPSDAPASALLVRVQARRKQLVAEGRIKASKSDAPSADQDVPFVVPVGWEWICAADACVVITDGDHQAPPKADSGVPFLVIGDVRDGAVGLGSATRFVPREYFDALDWGKQPRQGDILYTTVGSLGIPVPVVQQQAFCFQRHIALLRPGLPELQAFLTLALRSRLAFDQAESGATGIAQKTVPLSVLRSLRLPLPPLAEQARIVARVDELMRLCDALEEKGRLEAEQHARLLSTLLGTLTDSATPEELAANWQRVAEHFDLLLNRPEAVDALERTVLHLAVRGMLVAQRGEDEPAAQWLERQRTLRSTAASARSVSMPAGEPQDVPFQLPSGWAWSSLGELCAVTGGATPSKAVASNWSGTIPWVSPKDMKVPTIEDAQDHVSPNALKGSLSLIQAGSLLMVVRGMILAHSFPVAVTRVPVTINQDMKALTPWDQSVLAYLSLVCTGMKPEILALVERSSHGTCKLESAKIFSLPIPLPPLAEQARIIARVTELRRLCADLRQRLTASQTTQSRLAKGLVAAVI